MNLQIRDPRAHELARKLAEKRQTSLTDAVVTALEAELERENARVPVSQRLISIAKDLVERSPGGGRDMSKDEIDEMWGH